MIHKAIAILVGAFFFLAPESVWGDTLERDFHESFAVAPGARLELFHGDGSVSLRPWDRDEIDIEVHYKAVLRGVGLTTEPDFEVDFERKGKTIRVRGREHGRHGIGFFSSRQRDYTYTIRAPAWVILDLQGDDGDIDIAGWRAAIECELDDGDLLLADFRAAYARFDAEDGDVRINDFAGDLWISVDDGDVDIQDCKSDDLEIRTEDGDVTLDRCSGNFELRVDDGRIVVEKAEVSKVRIRASDGDVDLQLLAASDLDLEIEVDDGDVTLELSPQISASYSVETDDGKVRLSSDNGVRSEGGKRVTGQLGDGSGRIKITTTDGDVTLR